MKLKLTGPHSSPRPSWDRILKNYSQTSVLPQSPLLAPLPPLLMHPLLPLRRKVRSNIHRGIMLTVTIEKKEEEADVDMGGLFGDDY